MVMLVVANRVGMVLPVALVVAMVLGLVGEAQSTSGPGEIQQCSQGQATTTLSGLQIQMSFGPSCSTLTELSLQQPRAATLHQDDLYYLSNLEDLTIQGNGYLKNVEAGAFATLTKLTRLTIENTLIQTLSEELFDNSTSLTYISLRSNQIKFFPPDLFSSLTLLTTLILEGNCGLECLPSSKSTSVYSDVGYGISSPQSGSKDYLVFVSCSNITSLTIIDSDLSTLDSDIFSPLTSLESLTITSGSLQVIPADIFDQIPQLTELNLVGNKLERLPMEIFDNLRNLQKLDLTGNSGLTSLPAYALKENTKLETLNLPPLDCVLAQCPANISEPLPLFHNSKLYPICQASLSEVFCSREQKDYRCGRLTSLALIDETCYNLTRLSLFNSDILNLPTNIFHNLTNLQQLDLHRNNIQSLPDELFDGITLTNLDLSFNNLTSVRSEVFGPSSLSYPQVTLLGNPITCVPLPHQAFGQVISDSNPWLKGKPTCLQVQTCQEGQDLLTIDLSDHYYLVDESCGKSVTSLILTNCGNDSLIKSIFDSLTSIKTLTIDHSSLVSIPAGFFDPFQALTVMYLGGNNLSKLPVGLFDHNTELKELHLDDNEFMDFPIGMFSKIPKLRTLDLRSNPLACDPSHDSDLRHLDVKISSTPNLRPCEVYSKQPMVSSVICGFCVLGVCGVITLAMCRLQRRDRASEQMSSLETPLIATEIEMIENPD